MHEMKKPSRRIKTLLAFGLSAFCFLTWSKPVYSQDTISAQAADDLIIYRLQNLGTRGPDMDEALTCSILRDLGRLKPGTLKAVQCRTLPRDNAFGSGYFDLRDIRKFASDNFSSEAKSTAWLENVEFKIRDNAGAEHPEYAEQQLKICEATKDEVCASKYRTLAIIGFKARAESDDPKAMAQLVELAPKSYFQSYAFLKSFTDSLSGICDGASEEDCEEKYNIALKAKALEHKKSAQAHDAALKSQINSEHPEGWKLVEALRSNQEQWKQKAFDTYTEAAKLGDQAAMFSLGYMIDTRYVRSHGNKEHEYAVAADWYEKFFTKPSALRSKVLHRHSEEAYISLFRHISNCKDQIVKDGNKVSMWGQYQAEFETEHCDVTGEDKP